MSNKYLITYASGVTQEVFDDAADTGVLANQMFGLDIGDLAAQGCGIELLERDAVVAAGLSEASLEHAVTEGDDDEAKKALAEQLAAELALKEAEDKKVADEAAAAAAANQQG